MRHSSVPSLRANPKLSWALSITAGLILFEGMQSLIAAASMPLETVLARLVNALLRQGWRNVLLLSETRYPLLMVGQAALIGIVLLAIGFWIGSGVVRRAQAENEER